MSAPTDIVPDSEHRGLVGRLPQPLRQPGDKPAVLAVGDDLLGGHACPLPRVMAPA